MAQFAQDNPDAGLGVKFFMKPVQHMAKSKEAGRPIFEDREYVSIIFPGDRTREHVAPAHEMHYVSHEKRQMTYAERFAPIYQAWKSDGMEGGVGTPLSAATFLTPAKLEEMKSQRIHTVEQLAALPDSAIRKLGMGARELVEQAQAYIKAAQGTSEVAALQAQIEELKAMLSATRVGPPQDAPDPFEGLERDDLFNMASDAGLSPRSNASRESLVQMLTEAAKKKEAA